MKETIAAIATGLTESGIGIIRMSGPQSYEIIKKVFTTGSGKEPDLTDSHRAHHGFIHSNVSRETLDEVLILNMKGPHSYTGEDTIEIDCHGGILMMRRILQTLLQAGAFLAEPGEFTKRAFLNGRMDLSQAEAVMDVINAQNDRALKASVRQLRGAFSEKIKACRALLLEDTAYIEAALDDPEHISIEGFPEKLSKDIAKAQEEVAALLRSSEDGKMVREGIRTAIVGKPNAGKSTLLNALLGEERAIVTDIAGTTRDTLEETINLHGITLHMIDTAGIRETDDSIEKIGVNRALTAAKDADLVLYVMDGSARMDASDAEILDFLQHNHKKTIALLNKTDLPQANEEQKIRDFLPKEYGLLCISAKDKTGIKELERQIEELFYNGKISFNDEVFLASERQRQALQAAGDALALVQDSIGQGLSEDFYTVDLMEAYRQLGYILGEEVDEDLINTIFSRFCMGK